MEKNEKLTWTVKISVHKVWVIDGFNLDKERLHSMVAKSLGYATNDEIEVEIVEAPKEQEIKILQGYIDCPNCTEEQDECFTCMKQDC